MATEGTSAPLLQKIRSHLLEVAGSKPSPSTSTNPLPTFDEVVANAGSGHFRCHKCRASLLLGPNSRICATCGTPRDEAASSFQISFASTLAYQLLMASFQSQGSDVPTGKPIPYAEATSVWAEKTEQKDGLIACDISSLELKWPEDKQRGSDQHTIKAQAANANPPHRLGVDLEDFFGKSKSQKGSDIHTEHVITTGQVQDVGQHASAELVPLSSGNDCHIDLFATQPSRQKTQTDVGDDDPFLSWEADFQSAKPELNILGLKSLGGSAVPSADNPFRLTEENKGSVQAITSHSIVNGKGLSGDQMSGAKSTMHVQNSQLHDDPWSSIMTKEPYIGSSKIPEENNDLQSEWPETYQDSFTVSTWQQGDNFQNNKSTVGNVKNHMAGENGMVEFDTLFQSNPASQMLRVGEATSGTTTLTEVDLFNGVEDKTGNAQAKAVSAPLNMGNSMVTMPQVSSNDDSKQLVDSLLSEMHDLSFMLADHLVIPDGSRSQ